MGDSEGFNVGTDGMRDSEPLIEEVNPGQAEGSYGEEMGEEDEDDEEPRYFDQYGNEVPREQYEAFLAA